VDAAIVVLADGPTLAPASIARVLDAWRHFHAGAFGDAVEAGRKAAPEDAPCPLVEPRAWLATVSWGRFFKSTLLFALPIAAVVALTLWHNQARFGDPFEVGYRYLNVVWQKRIEKWGLFDYHYLPRNLGVIGASLPCVPAKAEAAAAPFQINAHGLALWFTTPAFFWLIWPKRKPNPHWALWITVALVALPSLFYQNTGWVQFGYRFSNDYVVFLFALTSPVRGGVEEVVLELARRLDPGEPGAHTLTPDEVVALVQAGARLGAKEALFSLGDRPEARFPEHREFLRREPAAI